MTHGRAAALGIFLAAVGWVLIAYGMLSQLGDPHPSVTEGELQRMHRISLSVLLLGLLLEAGSLWLAGYAFVGAKALSAVVVMTSVAGFAVFLAVFV